VIETLFPPPVTAKFEAIAWNAQKAVGFDRLEDFMRAVGAAETLGFDLTCEPVPPLTEAALTRLEDFMTAIGVEVLGDQSDLRPAYERAYSLDDFSKDLSTDKLTGLPE
jgi:hypothetical protein